MIGILSYGVYIPPTRLPLALLGGRRGEPSGPEKAVAWHDEDAITLGVTAAIRCLDGWDRDKVDMLVFASTTLPFEEKAAAPLAARAIDLRRDLQTSDQSGSTRAGTIALRAAFDAVQAGSAKQVLVIASDVRVAAPGSALESRFGDAAVAILVGDGDAIATLDESVAISEEITDLWRPSGHDFVHSWEDRFVVQESYLPCMQQAVQSLLARTKSSLDTFDRVVLAAPDARAQRDLARALAAPKERLQPALFGRVGNAGAAFGMLLLADALEAATGEERLLLADFGGGASASAFRTTASIGAHPSSRGVAWNLERRRLVTDYQDYLKARSLDAREWDAGTGPGLSATILYRERDDDLSLLGQRCRACQAVQFPAQRICESCFAKDDFDKIRLSDRTSRIVTYTFDYFFPTPNPPTIVSIVDVEGARIHLQVIEAAAEDIELGQEIEFVFRRIHSSGGRPNYYWKGVPKPGSD